MSRAYCVFAVPVPTSDNNVLHTEFVGTVGPVRAALIRLLLRVVKPTKIDSPDVITYPVEIDRSTHLLLDPDCSAIVRARIKGIIAHPPYAVDEGFCV